MRFMPFIMFCKIEKEKKQKNEIKYLRIQTQKSQSKHGWSDRRWKNEFSVATANWQTFIFLSFAKYRVSDETVKRVKTNQTLHSLALSLSLRLLFPIITTIQRQAQSKQSNRIKESIFIFVSIAECENTECASLDNARVHRTNTRAQKEKQNRDSTVI